MCDSSWIRQGGMNPSGNACLSKVWMQRPDDWIYIFELVTRLSELPAFFSVFHTSVGWMLKLLAAVPGVTISSKSQGLVDFSRDNNSFSNFAQVRCSTTCRMSHDQVRLQDMLAGMVTLLFWSLVRFNCARNSRVDDVSCPQGWRDI